MNVKWLPLRCRARWVRRCLRRGQETLTPCTRKRIALGALLLLMLVWLWFLFRGIPCMDATAFGRIEFPHLKP